MNSRSLFKFGSKSFSTAVFNYSNAANPKVFLTVAAGEKKIGDLVFELYADRQPGAAESFSALCSGVDGAGFAGTAFHQGLSGFGISGGRLAEENVGAFGVRLVDEDLTMRHNKRGMLTLPNEGENASGSEFTILFREAPYLDGYQTVLGELVEGEKVLKALEEGVDRLGNVTEDFKIVASGPK